MYTLSFCSGERGESKDERWMGTPTGVAWRVSAWRGERRNFAELVTAYAQFLFPNSTFPLGNVAPAVCPCDFTLKHDSTIDPLNSIIATRCKPIVEVPPKNKVAPNEIMVKVRHNSRAFSLPSTAHPTRLTCDRESKLRTSTRPTLSSLPFLPARVPSSAR